jgi:hypothetical protein
VYVDTGQETPSCRGISGAKVMKGDLLSSALANKEFMASNAEKNNVLCEVILSR